MSKKTRFVCLSFALIFLFASLCGVIKIFTNSPSFVYADSSAKSMCVMETSTHRVLYSKNENTSLPMASTTKIMTCITAIENCDDLDRVFKISPKAVGVSGTSIYLKNDEQMSMKDLLYGLMLVSGNDASVAIGEQICESKEKFVELMNQTAEKIGAKNTHFDNTHGLDSKTHYTTSYDLALITSYALENPIFREIVSTKSAKITNTDGKTRYLRNKNKLLFTLEGCIGVKTGFTDDAGRCLVSACEKDGMRVVCVVLNCGPMFEESKELLCKAFNQYKMYDLTKGYSYNNEIKVEGGQKDSIKIGTKESFFYPLREDELKKVSYAYEIQPYVEAPVDKDYEVGKIDIFIDKNLHFSEKIYTMENVRRNSIWVKLKDLLEKW
jgi:D-alanyl-D-alanine carboxypeptidase (penicillin-binding protein 5/6)